jgi:hypothetical protein
VLHTTLIPAIVRVRACRKGLFAGQATFGRCVSKTEWVYGFKVALSVSPDGVIFAFGLAEANSDERPIGEFLVASDGHGSYLADKGFSSVKWERRCLAEYGALVAATPQKSAKRAWPEKVCRWAAGKRQLVEGVICSSMITSPWSVTGPRPSENYSPDSRPRLQPTPADSYSTPGSVDHCAIWPISWFQDITQQTA